MILWHAGISMLVIWFVMRGNTRVDYRVVAVASLIPDLIDKPIGRMFFRDTFDSGRLFMHTLLVNAAFFCVMFFLRGRIKRQLVMIPIASLLHIAEDGVWSEPRLFWWPLFGTEFPRDPAGGSVLAFLNPLNHPWVLVQEGIGVLAIVWLLASHDMLSRDGVRTFLRTGHLEPVPV